MPWVKVFFICLRRNTARRQINMDLGWLGQIAFTWEFFAAVMSIVLIDLVLAGDNAVVIAMAVKNLPNKTRQWGIVLGAGGAVVIRVACTFLVAQLLTMPLVKLIGGALILWIAVKLLTDGAKEECHERECGSLWQALWVILVADMSMGIDNMLAVGAASHGNLFLLLFGLALSIPFVVFMSNLLSRWMERWPIILWIGAAVLGRVGGEMMITDPWVHNLLHPSKGVEYAIQAFFILSVCAGSKWLVSRRSVAEAAVQPVVLARPAGQNQGA
jgi:YjbE family integral membrane protein